MHKSSGFHRTDFAAPRGTSNNESCAPVFSSPVPVALAAPPHNSQSAFGVSERDAGNVRGDMDFIFDKVEDKIRERVQDGRDFVNHNGLICEFRPSNAMLR